MISSDLRTLVIKTFHLFDFDGNGVIEKKDFVDLAKKHAELTGKATDDLRDQLYYRTNIHLWNQIESHVDGEYGAEIPEGIFDGKITPTEWYKYWIDRIYTDKPNEVAFNWVNLIFDLVDEDGSGTIDRNEYKKFLELYNFSNVENVIEEIFNLVDTDKNDEISKEEMINNISGFFGKVKDNLKD